MREGERSRGRSKERDEEINKYLSEVLDNKHGEVRRWRQGERRGENESGERRR